MAARASVLRAGPTPSANMLGADLLAVLEAADAVDCMNRGDDGRAGDAGSVIEGVWRTADRFSAKFVRCRASAKKRRSPVSGSPPSLVPPRASTFGSRTPFQRKDLHFSTPRRQLCICATVRNCTLSCASTRLNARHIYHLSLLYNSFDTGIARRARRATHAVCIPRPPISSSRGHARLERIRSSYIPRPGTCSRSRGV